MENDTHHPINSLPRVINEVTEAAEEEEKINTKRICLVGELAYDERLLTAAKLFNVPVISSPTGLEFLSDTKWTTYFVLKDFEGNVFEVLSKTKHKVLGYPVILELSKAEIPELPLHHRPVFNYSMKGVVAVFTQIRCREELTELVYLIHMMGGSIRKDMNNRSTHLICNQAFGEKYRYALTFRLNVVRHSWISDAWKKRHEDDFCARNENFTVDHRMKSFENCRVAFIGFTEPERVNMSNLLRSYGGFETTSDDDTCTHKIIADNPVVVTDGANESILDTTMNLDDTDNFARQEQQKGNETDLPTLVEEDENTKSTHFSDCKDLEDTRNDGVILKNNDEENQISPIPKISTIAREIRTATKRRIAEEDDQMDNISIDSTTLSLSTKKPKLMRIGSFSKGVRKSLSLIRTPTRFFNSHKNDHDISASASMLSMESTFNETLTKPMKFLKKMTRLGGKNKDYDTPKGRRERSFIMPVDNGGDSRMNSTLPANMLKTPEKGQFACSTTSFLTPKTPKFFQSEFQMPKSTSKQFTAAQYEYQDDNKACSNNMVLGDQAKTEDHYDDTKFYVLRADWFWTTIAQGFAPEDDFLFKDYMKSIKDDYSERRDSLINNSAKVQRKRKRLSRVVLESTPGSANKRKSSTSDAGILSDSFIDYTASPDKNDSVKLNENISQTAVADAKKFSMRRNHFMDFYNTESNYVGILETIVTLFKNPLEKMADENPDQHDLLNKSELKSIFGNFLPIYEVHKRMLTKLQDLHANWTEECKIGEIFLEYRDKLIKAYPRYINAFEQMKATVIQCEQNKPRFQAFLKLNQSKPECGRQTLQELMIRPVQRLPSISLLLNDILKHTPKLNPDHDSLVEALTSIKEVMTYINEDKRRTESQKQMFDIFNEIENCPPSVISSHRSLISKCEVVELETSETLSGRGDHLMLFLFSDTLLICKKRSRANSQSKSPTNSTTFGKHTGPKPFKYIKLIPISQIRTVADISDSIRAFALQYRIGANIHDPSKDKICAFNIADEEVDKTIYIKNFCKQMADHACKADSSEFRVCVTSDEISIDTSEVNLGTLSKAFRLATRTRLKVGRAFSFNKTPSRKRNVPLNSPYGSNISLTPTVSSLHHLKIQSSSLTLNELDMVKPLVEQNLKKNQNRMEYEEM